MPDAEKEQLSLRLTEMETRHPGLTPATATTFYEAARVCLDRHHRPPTRFSVEDEGTAIGANVLWEPADANCQAAHANQTDATSWGAYCCALPSTEAVRGLVAVRRAENGTGADYYLDAPERRNTDLEHAVRLEVSGTDEGTPQQIRIRLLHKASQAKRGNSNLPALATVVGFKVSKIAMCNVSSHELD
jgi:hypothetical protein